MEGWRTQLEQWQEFGIAKVVAYVILTMDEQKRVLTFMEAALEHLYLINGRLYVVHLTPVDMLTLSADSVQQLDFRLLVEEGFDRSEKVVVILLIFVLRSLSNHMRGCHPFGFYETLFLLRIE